eukprot:5768954-Prymnesium_polylepis.1
MGSNRNTAGSHAFSDERETGRDGLDADARGVAAGRRALGGRRCGKRKADRVIDPVRLQRESAHAAKTRV